MYHLLSVSSAMLISFLIGLLFAAMCAIVGRQKGYSTALCILLGFFGRLICLLILILLPDRMQEQYESDHLKQELSSLTPTDGRTGAGFGTNARPGSLPPRQRMLEQRPPSVRRTPLPSFPPGRRRSSPAPGVAATRRAIGIPATPVACRFNMNMNKYRRCRYVCCAEP